MTYLGGTYGNTAMQYILEVLTLLHKTYLSFIQNFSLFLIGKI